MVEKRPGRQNKKIISPVRYTQSDSSGCVFSFACGIVVEIDIWKWKLKGSSIALPA
jgi:hypothetical protein